MSNTLCRPFVIHTLYLYIIICILIVATTTRNIVNQGGILQLDWFIVNEDVEI